MDELLPSDHPLSKIRGDFDAGILALPRRLRRATAAPAIRACRLKFCQELGCSCLSAALGASERALFEQFGMNAGFRWFVGLDWDDKVFDHSTLSRNRERLLG